MNSPERVRDLFDRAIELTRAERDAFLVQQCGGQPAILNECRQLIVAYEANIESEQLTASGPAHLPGHSGTASSAPVLSPGRVFGDYLIVRVVGRGGIGEVYEAEQLEHGRRVALKLLQRAPASPRDRRRFLREGRLAASVVHPNSVYVFGTEEVEGKQIITMELLTGGTLRDRVVTHGPMPVPDAIRAVLDAIAGLAAAAQKGVLHRDVKPSNCFVDRLGRVKIGDYGLSIPWMARDETALTEVGVILGTPGFSSPEQLLGEPVDVRSDIYSVGATLFYLLTGHAPFEDPNMVRLVTRATHEAPPSPRQFRATIPRNLAAIVLKCLSKNPSRRFQTYDELQVALQKFVHQQHAAPLGARLLAGLVDLAIVLLVIRVCALVIWRWNDNLSVGAESLVLTAAGTAIGVGYFGGFERFGGSPGKRVFGLRVEAADPGPVAEWRVWFRATVFVLACWIVPCGVLYDRTVSAATTPTQPLVRGTTFPAPRVLQRPQVVSPWNLADTPVVMRLAR